MLGNGTSTIERLKGLFHFLYLDVTFVVLIPHYHTNEQGLWNRNK